MGLYWGRFITPIFTLGNFGTIRHRDSRCLMAGLIVDVFFPNPATSDRVDDSAFLQSHQMCLFGIMSCEALLKEERDSRPQLVGLLHG